jgi:hypothetical protein
VAAEIIKWADFQKVPSPKYFYNNDFFGFVPVERQNAGRLAIENFKYFGSILPYNAVMSWKIPLTMGHHRNP